MARRYFQVLNPTATDKTNSRLAALSPHYTSADTNEPWLLETEIDFVFSNGVEYPSIDGAIHFANSVPITGNYRDASEFSIHTQAYCDSIQNRFGAANPTLTVTQYGAIAGQLTDAYLRLAQGWLGGAYLSYQDSVPSGDYTSAMRTQLMGYCEEYFDLFPWLKP